MKRFMIVAAMGCFIAAGAAYAAESNLQCTAQITPNYHTACIDGYQWMMKYEYDGCRTYEVPVAQKFAIWPKKSGKPKMMLPVPCEELDPVPVP